MDNTKRPFRRTLVAGVAWVALLAGTFVISPDASGQEAGVDAGLGNAFAQGYKVDPRSGRLSLGIGYGVSLAGHQNLVSQAESRSVDLGIIGSTLAGEGCDGGDPTLAKEDQPKPLTARSTDEDAGTQKQETEYGVDKQAVADGSPLARAIATTAAAGDPAVVQIGSTESLTESGVVDGKRVARAVTDVSKVSFLGGQVELRGLRWEAIYQTAPEELTSATFSIEGITVAGESLPIPEDNPAGPLAEANAVLQPLGFTLEPPTTRVESGIAFVDPMRIGIIPSEIRETILSPVIGGLQPVRESVFDALIAQDCGNATYILIADIVLGSVTGAGSLALEVGGVTATSSELKRTSFLGGFGGSLAPLPPSSNGGGNLAPTLSGTSGSPVSTGGVSSTAPSTTAPADDGGDQEVAAPIVDTEPISGSRGGPMVAVGLGGLLLLAALAEGDRRKMRRAQRTLPMEVTV